MLVSELQADLVTEERRCGWTSIYLNTFTLSIKHTHVSCSSGTDPASHGGDITVANEASTDVTLNSPSFFANIERRQRTHRVQAS
jgi:hypothetical protein